MRCLCRSVLLKCCYGRARPGGRVGACEWCVPPSHQRVCCPADGCNAVLRRDALANHLQRFHPAVECVADGRRAAAVAAAAGCGDLRTLFAAASAPRAAAKRKEREPEGPDDDEDVECRGAPRQGGVCLGWQYDDTCGKAAARRLVGLMSECLDLRKLCMSPCPLSRRDDAVRELHAIATRCGVELPPVATLVSELEVLSDRLVAASNSTYLADVTPVILPYSTSPNSNSRGRVTE
jgi:hypothetical protein